MVQKANLLDPSCLVFVFITSNFVVAHWETMGLPLGTLGFHLGSIWIPFGHPWAPFGHPWDPVSCLFTTLGRRPGHPWPLFGKRLEEDTQNDRKRYHQWKHFRRYFVFLWKVANSVWIEPARSDWGSGPLFSPFGRPFPAPHFNIVFFC